MLSGAGGWRGRIVLQVTLRSCLTSETNRHRYTVYACVCQFIQSRCTKTHLDLDQVPLQVLHFFHKNEMVLQNRCKQTCISKISKWPSLWHESTLHIYIYIYSATFFPFLYSGSSRIRGSMACCERFVAGRLATANAASRTELLPFFVLCWLKMLIFFVEYVLFLRVFSFKEEWNE